MRRQAQPVAFGRRLTLVGGPSGIRLLPVLLNSSGGYGATHTHECAAHSARPCPPCDSHANVNAAMLLEHYEKGMMLRRKSGAAVGVSVVTLMWACAGFELRPTEPHRAAPAPLSPASIVMQDSVLNTRITVDLKPLLQASEAAVLSAVQSPHLAGADSQAASEEKATDGENQTDPQPAAATASSEAADAKDPRAVAKPPEEPFEETDDELEDVPWMQIQEEVRMRAKVAPQVAQARIENDRLVVDVAVDLAAVLAIDRGRRGEQLFACGCNQEEWCGKGKGERRRIVATWSSPLQLASDWTFAGAPEFTLKAIDGCPLTRLQGKLFDPTEQLVTAMQERGAAALRTALAEFDGIRHEAEPLWKGLSTPMPQESSDNYRLLLRPRAMRAASVDLRGSFADLPIRIAVSPIFNGESPDSEAVGWPPPASVKHATGFRIGSELTVALESLESRLAKSFKGRRFPDRSTRYVEITEVNVFGTDGRAAIRFGLTGTARGEVFFLGDIEANPDLEELALQNVQLTPESHQALEMLYDEVEHGDLRLERSPWVNAAELRDEVERAAVWSLRKHLVSLRRNIHAAPQHAAIPHHEIWLAIKEITFLKSAMDGEAARVLLILSGRAGLERQASQE